MVRGVVQGRVKRVICMFVGLPLRRGLGLERSASITGCFMWYALTHKSTGL